MSNIKEEIKEILDNFEKYEARYKLHNETQFIITHREIQILLDCITNLQEENERLNNIIEKTESMLKRLMEEQEHCYKKYPENWEERTSISNTWLTSRDCYWSALNYLKKLKGSE